MLSNLQDACIHQLFEFQVKRSPNAIAVIYEGKQLTYQELNSQANQLAHHLRSLGVGPEVLVAACVDRSLESVVGLLGILKAGGAYVPLDPHYPQNRLAFMLEHSQTPVLLTQQHLVESLPEHQARVICLDGNVEIVDRFTEENPDSGVTSDNLAYVIYTSGSTGQPKGVAIEHRGAVSHPLGFSTTTDADACRLCCWLWQNSAIISAISPTQRRLDTPDFTRANQRFSF